MFCPACGQEAPESANFCRNCGQPLSWPTDAPGSQRAAITPLTPGQYAGFWKRFAAYFIDGLLIFFVSAGAGSAAGFILGAIAGLLGGASAAVKPASCAVGFLLGALISWLYWALMESSDKQATLGKMALGIKVTDLQGEPISFGRATGRYFGKIISSLILFIGFLMITWTEKKQALHDLMAGTLVVTKQDFS